MARTAGLLDAVADRGELVREVLTAGVGRVEVRLCAAERRRVRVDLLIEQGESDAPIIIARPRRTTRSRWRRRSEVCMREMPS